MFYAAHFNCYFRQISGQANATHTENAVQLMKFVHDFIFSDGSEDSRKLSVKVRIALLFFLCIVRRSIVTIMVAMMKYINTLYLKEIRIPVILFWHSFTKTRQSSTPSTTRFGTACRSTWTGSQYVTCGGPGRLQTDHLSTRQ